MYIQRVFRPKAGSTDFLFLSNFRPSICVLCLYWSPHISLSFCLFLFLYVLCMVLLAGTVYCNNIPILMYISVAPRPASDLFKPNMWIENPCIHEIVLLQFSTKHQVQSGNTTCAYIPPPHICTTPWYSIQPLVQYTTLGTVYNPWYSIKPLVQYKTLGTVYNPWYSIQPLVQYITLGTVYKPWYSI